jgi:hypothetical protein
MSEDVLMTGLSIILFSGISVFILSQIIRKTFPQGALVPFKSFEEIKSYFSTAISVLTAKRWLFILPLCFALSNHLIKIAIWLFQRSRLPSYSEPSAGDLSSALWAKVSFASILRSLLRTPNMLDYGYNGAITGGLLFMGFFVLFAITFRAESRKLRHYASEDNLTSVDYLETILKLSLILIIAIAVLTSAALLSDKWVWTLPFTLLGPGMMLLGLLGLSLYALIEGFILFAVKGLIDREELDFQETLNRSLSILRPLFLLNVLLTVIAIVPSLCLFPHTLDAFFDSGGGSSFGMEIFLHLSDFFGYLNSAVAALTVCAPFVLIVNKTGVIESLKGNFSFIGNNFLKYLIFTGIGILMLFTPSILSQVISVFCHPFSFCSMLMEVFFEVLRVSVAVIFYMALFGFFLETNARIVEGPVHT